MCTLPSPKFETKDQLDYGNESKEEFVWPITASDISLVAPSVTSFSFPKNYKAPMAAQSTSATSPQSQCFVLYIACLDGFVHCIEFGPDEKSVTELSNFPAASGSLWQHSSSFEAADDDEEIENVQEEDLNTDGAQSSSSPADQLDRLFKRKHLSARAKLARYVSEQPHHTRRLISSLHVHPDHPCRVVVGLWPLKFDSPPEDASVDPADQSSLSTSPPEDGHVMIASSDGATDHPLKSAARWLRRALIAEKVVSSVSASSSISSSFSPTSPAALSSSVSTHVPICRAEFGVWECDTNGEFGIFSLEHFLIVDATLEGRPLPIGVWGGLADGALRIVTAHLHLSPNSPAVPKFNLFVPRDVLRYPGGA
jgi:hypothetical protein